MRKWSKQRCCPSRGEYCQIERYGSLRLEVEVKIKSEPVDIVII